MTIVDAPATSGETVIPSTEWLAFPGARHCEYCGLERERYLRSVGAWCEQHGPHPVEIRWVNRDRCQFNVVVLPCFLCEVEVD